MAHNYIELVNTKFVYEFYLLITIKFNKLSQ